MIGYSESSFGKGLGLHLRLDFGLDPSATLRAEGVHHGALWREGGKVWRGLVGDAHLGGCRVVEEEKKKAGKKRKEKSNGHQGKDGDRDRDRERD